MKSPASFRKSQPKAKYVRSDVVVRQMRAAVKAQFRFSDWLGEEGIKGLIALAANGKTAPLQDYILDEDHFSQDDRDGLCLLISRFEVPPSKKQGRRGRPAQAIRAQAKRQLVTDVIKFKDQWRSEHQKPQVPKQIVVTFITAQKATRRHLRRVTVVEVLSAVRQSGNKRAKWPRVEKMRKLGRRKTN